MYIRRQYKDYTFPLAVTVLPIVTIPLCLDQGLDRNVVDDQIGLDVLLDVE